jgi:hypothetical protein
MKSNLIHLIVFVFLINIALGQEVGSVTNATDFKLLDQGLLSLKRLMDKESVIHTEATLLELDIRRQVDNIYLDMNTRLPDGDGTVTPEWKDFTKHLADVLAPHTEVILESAYRPKVDKNREKRQLNRLTFDADQLIGFLSPDRRVELLMREKLQQYPTLKWEIYRHLHELRLLRETDVNDMEALGETISEPKEKIKWAEEVSFYGSDAGLETLREILSVPFDPSGSVNERGGPESNLSFDNYIPVLRAIHFLGAKGLTLLPVIKTREAQVFEEYQKLFGLEFATKATHLFKEMEIYINGRSSPYPSARNRSGILYPPGQGSTNKVVKQNVKGSGSEAYLRPKKQNELSLTARSNRPSESGDLLKWILSSLAVVGLAISLVLVFRTKARR